MGWPMSEPPRVALTAHSGGAGGRGRGKAPKQAGGSGGEPPPAPPPSASEKRRLLASHWAHLGALGRFLGQVAGLLRTLDEGLLLPDEADPRFDDDPVVVLSGAYGDHATKLEAQAAELERHARAARERYGLPPAEEEGSLAPALQAAGETLRGAAGARPRRPSGTPGRLSPPEEETR